MSKCLRILFFCGVSFLSPLGSLQAQTLENSPGTNLVPIPVVEFSETVNTGTGESIKIQHSVVAVETASLDEQVEQYAAEKLIETADLDPNSQMIATTVDFEDLQETQAVTQKRAYRILEKVKDRVTKAGRKLGGYVQKSLVNPVARRLKPPAEPTLRYWKIGDKKFEKLSTLMIISRFVVPGALTAITMNVTANVPLSLITGYASSILVASGIFAINSARVNWLQGAGRVWDSDRLEVFNAYQEGREPNTKWFSANKFLSRSEYLTAQEEYVHSLTNGKDGVPPVLIDEKIDGKRVSRNLTREEALRRFRLSEEIYSKNGIFLFSGKNLNTMHGLFNFFALECVFAGIFAYAYYGVLDIDLYTLKSFSAVGFATAAAVSTATQGLVEQALTRFRSTAQSTYGWTEKQISAYFLRMSAAASIVSVSAFAILEAVPDLKVASYAAFAGLGVSGIKLLWRTQVHSKQVKERIQVEGPCEATFNPTLRKSLETHLKAPDAA